MELKNKNNSAKDSRTYYSLKVYSQKYTGYMHFQYKKYLIPALCALVNKIKNKLSKKCKNEHKLS